MSSVCTIPFPHFIDTASIPRTSRNQSSRISVLVSTGTHTSGASFLFIWACRLASSWPVYTLASVWMAYLPSVWVYSVGCIRGEAPFLGTNVPAGLQCRYVLWLHGFTITFQLPAGSGIDRTLALCVPFACICLRLALIRIKVVIPVATSSRIQVPIYSWCAMCDVCYPQRHGLAAFLYGEHGPGMGCRLDSAKACKVFGFGCRRFDSDPIGTMIIFNTYGFHSSRWASSSHNRPTL